VSFWVQAAEQQPLRLAALVFGNVHAEQWGETARPVDFFDLRADLEALLLPLASGIGGVSNWQHSTQAKAQKF
jgi:phenylalanyl-tRNA synthetase beta subunit